MAVIPTLRDFVMETVPAMTGTGAYALGGSPATKPMFGTFLSRVGDGVTTRYCAISLTTGRFEIMEGAPAAGSPNATLSRVSCKRSFDGISYGASPINWTLSDGPITIYTLADASLIQSARFQGRRQIDVTRSAWIPRTTSPPAAGSSELATGKVMQVGYDFDQTTDEYLQFLWLPPKSWNGSYVFLEYVWTFGSGSGSVVWGSRAVAYRDDDPMNVAFGTASVVTDAGIAANDVHRIVDPVGILPAGTIAPGVAVLFDIYRNAANGSDTLNADARLLGLRLHYDVDKANDD